MSSSPGGYSSSVDISSSYPPIASILQRHESPPATSYSYDPLLTAWHSTPITCSSILLPLPRPCPSSLHYQISPPKNITPISIYRVFRPPADPHVYSPLFIWLFCFGSSLPQWRCGCSLFWFFYAVHQTLVSSHPIPLLVNIHIPSSPYLLPR
jgi:hypothetical protein